MNPTTNLEDFLLFVPLIALLVFWHFRMADSLRPRKHAPQVPRPTKPVADPADASLMSDPDGRPWN
jgi:hypothetical protein